MATIPLTKDNFEQVVKDNDMVLVDFWAPWCGPCKGFAPVFEAASEKHADIVFGKVNSDDEQELAASFNIRSIPTQHPFDPDPGAFPREGDSLLSGGRAPGFGARAGHYPRQGARHGGGAQGNRRSRIRLADQGVTDEPLQPRRAAMAPSAEIKKAGDFPAFSSG